MKKTILVLANSLKKGGRCVAGIEILKNDAENMQFGKFIRPIDATQPEGKLQINTTTINHRAVESLDIVEIEFRGYANDSNHLEDWIIDHSLRWKYLGSLLFEALEHVPHSHEDPWGNTKSIIPGSVKASLHLIKTTHRCKVHAKCEPGFYYPKVKSKIALKNKIINITDPEFTKKHKLHELKLDEHKDFEIAPSSFILLSLTPPFTNNDGYTAQYRVVAAIIENDA